MKVTTLCPPPSQTGDFNPLRASSIGLPLVWRNVWDDVSKCVRVYFKHSLNDKDRFDKAEW
eukprot:91338-Pleurochrysis_carterae.AAC.2